MSIQLTRFTLLDMSANEFALFNKTIYYSLSLVNEQNFKYQALTMPKFFIKVD